MEGAAASARRFWASCHGGPLGGHGLRLGHQADAAAHPHQGPVRWDGVGQCAAAQVDHELIEGLGRLPTHVAVVDLHARRAVAVGQALGLLQGEDAVGCRPAGPDAERGFGVLEQLGRAPEQAGDVGADRDHVGAHRLGVQHVVEGGRAPHLGRRHAAQVGDLAHGLGAQPAVLLLGQVAQGDERRAWLGVERHQVPGPRQQFRREMAHRSTSPMTGSTEEMTATASAIRPTAQQHRQHLEVDEARPPDVHAVGLRRPVGDQVAAELAPGRLDGHVDLALGHPEALGEDLEVVDQGLHALVDAGPWRRRHLAVLHPVVPRRHLVGDLADHLDRLANLVEAHRVAVEVVAVGADDHVEVDLVVGQVRHGPPQVPGHAGRAQDGPGHREGQCLLGRQVAHRFGPFPEDRLAGQQLVVLEGAGHDGVADDLDVVLPPVGQVGRHAARAGCSWCSCAGPVVFSKKASTISRSRNP